MKTTEILLQAEKSNTVKTQNQSTIRKGLKYLLVIFMLSWVCFLPSCAVELRTPQPGITVESHNHRRFHRNHYRRSHIEYHDQDDHHR